MNDTPEFNGWTRELAPDVQFWEERIGDKGTFRRSGEHTDAMLMRITSTSVPEWQLVASLAFQLVTGVGMVWLMARLFRVQTLLSGESPSVKRFLDAIQG
jgi:hypothetical protein